MQPGGGDGRPAVPFRFLGGAQRCRNALQRAASRCNCGALALQVP